MTVSPTCAIVGAAESTDIGRVPHFSSTGLALDAAANALADAGLTAADIDGLTTGYFPVADVSTQLGIYPSWADNTVVAVVRGCSNYATQSPPSQPDTAPRCSSSTASRLAAPDT